MTPLPILLEAVACNLALSDERLSLVNTIIPNCSSYFTALHYINNLKPQRSYNTTVNLENLKFKKKNLSNGFKIIRLFVKVVFTKPLTRAPR